MTTKITVVCDNPTDPDVFEAGYPAQLALARTVPGLQSLQSSKVWPKEDGSPMRACRLLDLSFAGYDAASGAVTTDEAAAVFTSIFDLATGGVRIVFAEVKA